MTPLASDLAAARRNRDRWTKEGIRVVPRARPPRTPTYPDRMPDGSIRRFTSIGSYPIFYVQSGHRALCPGCADGVEDLTRHPNWEDPALYCDECEQRIESAYAEDEADTDTDNTTDKDPDR